VGEERRRGESVTERKSVLRILEKIDLPWVGDRPSQASVVELCDVMDGFV